jgi:hypothetical protein
MSQDNPLAAFNLNINLSGVETGMPVLVAAHYLVEIEEVDVKDSKNVPGNQNLFVKCKTLGPATSVQGQKEGKTEDVKAGFPISLFIPLQQSSNPDAPQFEKRLAELQDAVEGTDVKTRNPSFNPFAYSGKRLVVQLATQEDEQYGLTNNAKRLSAVPA